MDWVRLVSLDLHASLDGWSSRLTTACLNSPPLSDPLIYDVACNLAEMHMDDVGLQVSRQTAGPRNLIHLAFRLLILSIPHPFRLTQTEWHDILVDDATAEEVWKGVKRSYWNLPVYRMPVASYSM